MPTFHYIAVDGKGKENSGSLHAASEKEVRHFLRMEGLILTKIKSASNISYRFTKQELLQFTQQFKELLSAGLPVFESLELLMHQLKEKKWTRLFFTLSEEIQRGSLFSDALKLFPELFDSSYIAIVKSGEMSGALIQVFEELASDLEKKLKLQKQIITSLTYPLLLIGFAALVFSLLLFFVIPSMEALFDPAKLKGLTAFVFASSFFARQYGNLLFFVLFLFFGVCFFKRKAIMQSKKMWAFIMKLPLLKDIFLKLSLARFFRTLTTLQRAGINLLEALSMGQEVIGFQPLKNAISVIIDRVKEGSQLSEEFKKLSWVPPIIFRMLAVAEASGGSFTTYQRIAEMFEAEVEKTLNRFTVLLGPTILIFMGAMVGIVMLSVLLPLSDTTIFIGE